MNFTGVLFAGGESRRMGTDKATLTVQGEPLWSRQLRVLRELPVEKILVSARVRPRWCPLDVGVVLDEPPSRGPLSGLAAALRRAATPHVLALAIDLPCMTREHLAKLMARARPGCGVLPVRDGEGEPLCAIYPVQALSAATEALESGNLSLRHFASFLWSRQFLQTYALAAGEADLYRNCNTPADLVF